MPADREALRDQAEAWIANDPDPGDQAELRNLLADGSTAAWAELADRFEIGRASCRERVCLLV